MSGVEGVTRFDVRPRIKATRALGDANPASAEVLEQLSLTLTAFRRFKDLECARLDPWEACSLSVAEQALERAWLALSQLHADLQGPRRQA